MKIELKTAGTYLLALCFSISLAGCGSNDPKTNGTQPKQRSQSETTKDKVAANDGKIEARRTANETSVDEVEVGTPKTGSSLEGTWLGLAFINEDQLNQELSKLPAEERKQVLDAAVLFASTEVAFRFQGDGTFVHEMAMRPQGGNVIQESVAGTWKVLGKNRQVYRVQCVETAQDGTTTVVEKTCRMYEDGKNMSLDVTLQGVLSLCSPMIILERQLDVEEKEILSRTASSSMELK